MTIEAIDAFIEKKQIDTNRQGWRTRLPKPPQGAFDDGKTVYWHLETNHGTVKVRLLSDEAPMHVSSTVYLTRLGFYDGLTFHRVIPGFMAQGGCPLGRGTAGPGYQYDGEFGGSTKHDGPGKLSMANAGPGTDGSQFFLTFTKTAWLDGKHTVFGEVVDGLPVLQALEKCGTPGGGTTEKLVIERATISAE